MDDKLLSQTVGEVAEAAAKPLATSMGQTLSDAWFLIFGRIGFEADKRRAKYAASLEQFKQELEDSINEVPEQSRIEPSTQVAAGALSDAQYCIEEPELREMFCKLLTSSVNKDKADHVLPMFSSIIRRMSPADAVLLRKLGNVFRPIVNYQITTSSSNGYRDVMQNVLAIDGAVLDNPTAKAVSLDVLQTLGLIEITYSLFLTVPNTDAYSPFETYSVYIRLQAQHGSKAKYEKGLVRLTPLGKRFYSICVE